MTREKIKKVIEYSAAIAAGIAGLVGAIAGLSSTFKEKIHHAGIKVFW